MMKKKEKKRQIEEFCVFSNSEEGKKEGRRKSDANGDKSRYRARKKYSGRKWYSVMMECVRYSCIRDDVCHMEKENDERRRKGKKKEEGRNDRY